MTTEEGDLNSIRQSAQALAELVGRMGPHFRRAEVRKRMGRYLEGLLASVERKNGWQMAEALGETNAHGVQRLLEEAEWDENAVRDELRTYVLEHLGEPAGILVVDETGFVKKGKKSAGVARQYSGTAGRRENSQVGVFLSYASSKGAAFIDRALYLPKEWTQDRVRCREAGIPDEVGFATKGELAQQMLARAFAAGVPAGWVVADTVYGYDELRLWLEEQQKHYVLAVPETHQVWVQGHPQPVGLLAALLPDEAWVVLSAGEGSKGPRLYEWAWLQLPDETEAESSRTRWVLIRRSLADHSERAYYRVYGPATTTLAEVVRVTGTRWKIEEGYEQAKGEVGLDQYEVRTWCAWYRYITLALLAYAALIVMRTQACAHEKKWRRSRVGRVERAGGTPLIPSAERVAGAASPPPALVGLSAPASEASAALSSAAPRSPGTCGVSSFTGALALAGSPGAHRRAVGAAPPALAAAEAADRPSSPRSSPDGGGHAVGRAHGLVLA